MVTSKSPRKVLKLACLLARQVLADYDSPFGRHDFTNPQLFACLVLREHQQKRFRGIEALLADCPDWLDDIGLQKPPDHNTLCRAFDRFMKPALATSMLDLMAGYARQRKILNRNRLKPLAVGSTPFESHHVSRHFDRRRRDTDAKKSRDRGERASIAADAGP